MGETLWGRNTDRSKLHQEQQMGETERQRAAVGARWVNKTGMKQHIVISSTDHPLNICLSAPDNLHDIDPHLQSQVQEGDMFAH